MGCSIAQFKKRKFSFNQHLKSSKYIQLDTSISDPSLSASSRKIVTTEISGNETNYNTIINFDFKCTECGNDWFKK